MKATQYAGIDYSLGQSNIDKSNGIRYGVISCNTPNPEALDDVYTNGRDLAWEEAIADLAKEHGEDSEALEQATERLGDNWETQLGNLLYEQDGYKLTGCLDNDLFVLKSRFYTFAQFCSPCVPGAGNLDNPCPDGPRSYCLGHDWFDGGKAPYPVYSVETGEEVQPNP